MLSLKRMKADCVRVACAIAHARGGGCRADCGGQHLGKLEAHHCVPRSRGWRYAADPDNIVLLCLRHHALVEDGQIHPTAVTTTKELMRDKYQVSPVTRDEVLLHGAWLAGMAAAHGLSVPKWMRE